MKQTFFSPLIRKLIMTMTLIFLLAGFFNGKIQAEVAKSYNDVNSNHWASQAIHLMSQQGLMNGYPDGTFKPNANVSRAEMIAILTRVLDIPANSQAFPFKDNEGKWSHGAIGAVVEVGIINPSEYGQQFKPSQPTTRAEISRFLAQGLAVKNPEYLQAINESKGTLLPIPEYYGEGLNEKDIPYIAVAMGTGLLKGYENATFRPNNNTTRAEVAVILSRYLNVIQKDPSDYRDLEELRAVGTKGTNFHVIVENGMVLNGSDEFSDVRNKKVTFTRNNVGYAQVNRLIWFGGQTKATMNSIYTDMFYDDTLFTHPDVMPFAIEKSFTALKDYDNHFVARYLNGSPSMRLIVGKPMVGKNVDKYNLTARPIVEPVRFMSKLNGKRFWEYGNHQISNPFAPLITDDGSNYTIKINK